MIPRINNKLLFECNIEELKILLHNSDYRESSYLEYKKDFSFLCCPNEQKENEIIEFRNDVCSFANSAGGYLIYGIKEENGIAEEFTGVEIQNTDKFELQLRNKLVTIMPKVPLLNIKPVMINKEKKNYLVIIFIEHDFYAPYIHKDNKNNYKIYKHDGNQKNNIGYVELKNMFIQSKFLEDEIRVFQKNRIEYFKSLKYDKFLIFHMIPDNFLDVKKPLFVIEQQTQQRFGTVFDGTKIDSLSLPCVDGLRFVSLEMEEEGIIYNNGTIEYVLQLNSPYIDAIDCGYYFYKDEIWYNIERVAIGYKKIIPQLFNSFRYFGCISIIGCKDIITEEIENKKYTRIDRDDIICQLICFPNDGDKDAFNRCLNKLLLEFYLSIGLRKNETVKEIISKINLT